jgi:hypothetical protein
MTQRKFLVGYLVIIVVVFAVVSAVIGGSPVAIGLAVAAVFAIWQLLSLRFPGLRP